MADPLDERYIKNAAVLPDLCQPSPPATSSAHASSTSGGAPQDEPLLTHGHTVKEYQAIYHSVVDPMLKTRSGKTRPYSLELGHGIKQRLWEKLFCPTLIETEDADGRVHIFEAHRSPTLKSYAPQIDVDISGEPEQPMRKRARH